MNLTGSQRQQVRDAVLSAVTSAKDLRYFDFVFINRLVFSDNGMLTGVRASAYDFEGKGNALDLICDRVGCTSKEAVFAGDHFNDKSIMLKVDKAVAYPPHDVVVTGASQVSILENNLLAILPHVLVE